MHEDLLYLRAIFNQPDDDGLRLVYADWLEERGDLRAEFLRLDVERHRSTKVGKKRQARFAKQMRDLSSKLDPHWVRRMWQARNLALGGRLDLTFVGDGKGLIEVRGGREETVLLVEGRPVALNWDDCHGSVGQYLVFTGHTRGSDHARQLTEFVEGEVDGGRPLAVQIGPLLTLFAPGIYCLSYTPEAGVATFESRGGSRADRELVGYYPTDNFNLVFTQTRESLHEERVAFFREQIRAGRRPIVLTASAEGAWCEFVIDGHHKLTAYNLEHVRPSVLCIVRWQAPRISLEEGLGCLAAGHPGIKEYRRMKRYAMNPTDFR